MDFLLMNHSVSHLLSYHFSRCLLETMTCSSGRTISFSHHRIFIFALLSPLNSVPQMSAWLTPHCLENLLAAPGLSCGVQALICACRIYFLAVVGQSLSHVQLFATPLTAAGQASLSFTISQSLLQLMSIESVMPPTISSSVVPFSFGLQSFPASGSFPVSQLFTSGGQSIGVSASASVLPINIQG